MSAVEPAENGQVDSQGVDTQRIDAERVDTGRVDTGRVDTGRVDTGRVDTGRVERAVRELLSAIGEDPDRPGLVDTPARVARACTEIFAGVGKDPDAVLDAQFAEDFHEMVVVRDITFYSMCEHHLLPFFGVAHIVYIPGEEGKVTGLSKLARLVEGYARRPQVQERLTTQIANALRDRLGAAGVLVVVEAEHMCITMRGVRNSGSRTVTSAVRGMLRKPSTRAEAMSLIERGA